MTLQVKICLSLLLSLLIAYTSYSGWRLYHRDDFVSRATESRSRHIERTRAMGSIADSELVDTAGKPFSLDSLAGKVWLASFFFSSCPGPCAQMNRAIAGLQNDWKDDNLKFVSITVDPTNDTPEVLAKYARTFHADPERWTFLSGPFAKVQALGTEAFQVPIGPKMHTERVILVDKWKNVRSMYLTSDATQMLALNRKIKELLAEETPPAKTDDSDSVVAIREAESPKDEVSNGGPAVADAPSSAAAASESSTPLEGASATAGPAKADTEAKP
jgi:cytochrome oxidase Cu insertion factor (SCO1/SenC/PrrC family)